VRSAAVFTNSTKHTKMKGGERGLLQTEATYQAEIFNIAQYLNTKHTDYQFVNIFKVTNAINQI
jgi:hypothetical protein